MKIIHSFPPNYADIIAAFPSVATEKYVVFTYGDCIYNPAGIALPEHLVRHEQVHVKQQAQYTSPDAWWNFYLENAVFRFGQELEAYRVEYKHFCKMYKDRNRRADFLNFIAGSLSSPLYGSLCSRREASAKISI